MLVDPLRSSKVSIKGADVLIVTSSLVSSLEVEMDPPNDRSSRSETFKFDPFLLFNALLIIRGTCCRHNKLMRKTTLTHAYSIDSRS